MTERGVPDILRNRDMYKGKSREAVPKRAAKALSLYKETKTEYRAVQGMRGTDRGTETLPNGRLTNGAGQPSRT